MAKGVRDPQRIIRRNGYASESRPTWFFKGPAAAIPTGSRRVLGFDTGGDHHDVPLAATRWWTESTSGIVSESETRQWGYSEVLELQVWWDGGILRLRDPLTGEFIRTHVESEDAVESERAARAAAEARAAEMEAELHRLRY